MPEPMNYYYGNEADQYSFYRIPKLLFTDARFRQVSAEAKILYGLLLDRMALSVKNRWLDQEGRVYIIFTVAEVMETLGCAEQKANKLLNELDCVKGVGLIERKRRGLGKPNMIYVKNFLHRSRTPTECQHPEPQIQNHENHNSAAMKSTNPDLRESQGNKTDFSNTDMNHIHPSLCSAAPSLTHRSKAGSPAENSSRISGSPDESGTTYQTARSDTSTRPATPTGSDAFVRPGVSSRPDSSPSPCTPDRANTAGPSWKTAASTDTCRDQIKSMIGYDQLFHDDPGGQERLDGFVELIAEVCCSSRKTIRINQEDLPMEVVKSRFQKLDSDHIRYVMECLDKNTTQIGNIRAYLLSALYNAPVTISQYYSSLVKHHMAAGFPGG